MNTLFHMRKYSPLLSFLCIIFFSIPSVHGFNRTEKIHYLTRDGVDIKGMLYLSKKKDSPSIILLHMLGGQRKDWYRFAARFKNLPFNLLAIDLRGHGESIQIGKKKKRWRSFNSTDFNNMVEDVAGAKKFLSSFPEVDPTKICIVGASIGSNVALAYASRDSDVKTVVLLSPGLDYRGVKALKSIKEYGDRPILIVASREDVYSAESSNTLYDASTARKKLLKLFKGAGHGTHMFARKSELYTMIIDWINDVFEVEHDN